MRADLLLAAADLSGTMTFALLVVIASSCLAVAICILLARRIRAIGERAKDAAPENAASGPRKGRL